MASPISKAVRFLRIARHHQGDWLFANGVSGKVSDYLDPDQN